MVTLDDVRAYVGELPRSYEALVRGRVKFRVGRIVYLAFARDETMMGFAFPREERPLLVETWPEKFLMPKQSDLRYNWVVVRLGAIDGAEMRELVLDAWRMVVPKGVARDWMRTHQADYDPPMPDRLFFTESDESNELIASDPMALLVGFALDQQVSVQKAFAGPLALRERLGSLDAAAIADADLDAIFRVKPAIHRFPGAMAKRVQDLAAHIRDHYDGDAARVWTDAKNGDELRANLSGLPGFGEMKVKALGSVLAKRFGVKAADDLVPWHPTLGDVDSAKALEDYQAAKRIHKAEWSKAKAPAKSKPKAKPKAKAKA